MSGRVVCSKIQFNAKSCYKSYFATPPIKANLSDCILCTNNWPIIIVLHFKMKSMTVRRGQIFLQRIYGNSRLSPTTNPQQMQHFIAVMWCGGIAAHMIRKINILT